MPLHTFNHKWLLALAGVLLASTLLFGFTACSSLGQSAPYFTATATVPATAFPTRTVQPSPAPSVTATSTPLPRATPSPTPTLTRQSTQTPGPSQTPSPIPLATKQVLLQISNTPGDGGDYFDAPFGRITPRLVLYTDGEFMVATNNGWYLETMLSTAQMCSLLHRIANTGFFQMAGTGELGRDDPIYSFTATPEQSEGASGLAIQVNGNPAKYVDIYSPYQANVVGPIQSVLRLLNNYRPAGLKPYLPPRLLMVVEAGGGLFDFSDPGEGTDPTATPAALAWPSELPPLSAWLGGVGPSQIFIQGDQVPPLLALKLPKHYGVLTDRGQTYSMIMRPLLPHETLDANDYGIPYGAAQFELPFHCAP